MSLEGWPAAYPGNKSVSAAPKVRTVTIRISRRCIEKISLAVPPSAENRRCVRLANNDPYAPLSDQGDVRAGGTLDGCLARSPPRANRLVTGQPDGRRLRRASPPSRAGRPRRGP